MASPEQKVKIEVDLSQWSSDHARRYVAEALWNVCDDGRLWDLVLDAVYEYSRELTEGAAIEMIETVENFGSVEVVNNLQYLETE